MLRVRTRTERKFLYPSIFVKDLVRNWAVVPTTPEAEVGGSQIQGSPGLQSDFKTSPSNFTVTLISESKELG